MSYCYVGALPCGCIEGATVDMSDHPEEVAAFVKSMIEDGLAVHRMETDAAKALPEFFRECGPNGTGHQEATQETP